MPQASDFISFIVGIATISMLSFPFVAFILILGNLLKSRHD